jgi:hypothetical protein
MITVYRAPTPDLTLADRFFEQTRAGRSRIRCEGYNQPPGRAIMASSSNFDHQSLFTQRIRTAPGGEISCSVSRLVWQRSRTPAPYRAWVAVELADEHAVSRASLCLTRAQLREVADVLTAAADAWDAEPEHCACGSPKRETDDRCAACLASDRDAFGRLPANDGGA